ncbi:hypothetical protein [Treponema sp. R80B11-R83G3]
MDINTYERLWENIIKPKINEMLSNDDDIIFNDGQFKERVWLTYEEYKNKVHTYMHNPDGRIDRHKIASVMLYSIIINKPFELKYLHAKQMLKSSSFIANEILGFHVALAIVWSFILQDANDKSDKNKQEIFNRGFVFPECQHDSYPTHVYKMLYYSKLNNCYDIFAFSHVLFFIEAYTELVRKHELIEKVLT